MQGGNSQNLQLLSTAYPTVNRDAVLVPPTNRQLIVHSFIAVNNGPSASDVGFGVRFSPSSWKIFDQVGTELSTTDRLFTTVAGEGFILQSRSKFNGLAIQMSQAETGTPTYTYEYWNGTAWTPLTLMGTPGFAGTEGYITFFSPIDWTPGHDGLLPNIGIAQPGYAIRVLSPTPGGQDVIASRINLMRFIVVRRNVGSQMHLQIRFTERPMLLEAEEALVPYFAVPNASNLVEVSYQVLL